MAAYLWFEVRRVLRDRRYLIFTIAFPLAIYLLFTHVNDQGGGSVDGVGVAAYLMASMAAYGAMGGALSATSVRLAAERSSGWVRQLRATPLPAHSYLVVKLLAALSLALPVVVLVALAGALVNGVHLEAVRWVELVGLLWIGTLPFAGLGILLGYLLDVNSAQPAMVGVYLALAVLGACGHRWTRCLRACAWLGTRCPPTTSPTSAGARSPDRRRPPRTCWCWRATRYCSGRWRSGATAARH